MGYLNEILELQAMGLTREQAEAAHNTEMHLAYSEDQEDEDDRSRS